GGRGEGGWRALRASRDARAGVPADEPVALARRALADGELLKGFGGSTVPACTVLAMADLDEVLVIYDDLRADGQKRGSTLQFAAATVFGAPPLLWPRDPVEAEGR